VKCPIAHYKIECPNFSKKNCYNPQCDFKHDVSVMYKDENDQEFQNRLVSAYQDLFILKPLEQYLVSQTSLDLQFILDLTSSMVGVLN
jgi:hypothetical protein